MKTCPSCGATYPDEASFCSRDRTPLDAASAPEDLTGRVVAQRYRVLGLLGEGGMGRVYLAEHVMIGRKSALKVLSRNQLADHDARERFTREASNAARIAHPNVCAIYDFGPTGTGPYYLAMEYVEGSTLKALLAEAGTLSLSRTVRLLEQCADGLAAAHALGIVHRDLKPDNVMVMPGPPETIKIVDFGIAKAVAGEPRQQVTRTGFVVGTPEYMSPEQLSGDPVDPRSDVYSLGLVTYRCLTGLQPFQAGTAQETFTKRLTEDPPPLAAVRPDLRFPPELQAVLDQALARFPKDRYPSAVAFSQAFRFALGSAPELLDPPPTRILASERTQTVAGGVERTIPPTRVEAPRTRSNRVGPLIAALVLAMLLMSAVYALRGPLLGVSPRRGTLGPEASATPGTPAASRDSAAPAEDDMADDPPSAEPDRGVGTTDSGNRATTGPTPDVAAIMAELAALQDSILANATEATPRRRAEEIFGVSGYPDSVHLRAALTVASGYVETGRSEEAVSWYRRALALVAPGDSLRTSIETLIRHLEPPTN